MKIKPTLKKLRDAYSLALLAWQEKGYVIIVRHSDTDTEVKTNISIEHIGTTVASGMEVLLQSKELQS